MGTKNAKNNNNQPMAEWMMKQGTKWQLTNVLNYNFTLDDDAHDIRLMLGQEIKHQQTKTKTYSTRYFPENTTAEQAFDNLSLGTPYENSSKADSPSRISSFFGRIIMDIRTNIWLRLRFVPTAHRNSLPIIVGDSFRQELWHGVFPMKTLCRTFPGFPT